MRNPFLHTAAATALVALAFPAAAAAQQSACPSREEVTAAIARFEKSCTGPESLADGRIIRAFGSESKEVLLHWTKDTLPWTHEKWTLPDAAEKEIGTALFTAYAAGIIRSQLAAGRARMEDPRAGWLMVFKAYKEVRLKHPAYTSPSIEKLERMEKDGALKAHAAAVPFPPERK